MAIKQFKTESKRLLDMMANSIYTNTDIFLRELISNASDALDKLKYKTLIDGTTPEGELKIDLSFTEDKKRTLTISDNGFLGKLHAWFIKTAGSGTAFDCAV